MRRFAAKLAQGVLTVALLVVAVFALVRMLPGDPARAVAGELATAEDVERVRREIGLDESLASQLADYVRRLAGGDLGESVRTFTPVEDEILERLPRTALLAGLSMAVAVVAGLALAAAAARRPGSWVDRAAGVVSVLSYGTPVFWIGLVCIDVFAIRLGLVPTGGHGTWQHLVLPTAVLGFFLMGPIAEITRNSLDEVMRKEFVWTARAKGLGENRVVVVHALRNAVLPTLAFLGTQAGVLFGGAAITETVFSWQGLGQLVVDAALARDFPLLQGLIVVIGLMFVVINSLLELVYERVDPRLGQPA